MTDNVVTETGGGNPAPSAPAPTATPAPTNQSPSAAPENQNPAPTPPPSTEETKADPAPSEKPPENGWKLPDQYKDEPWAKVVKSEEDLYKELSALTSIKGKKNVAPDFKTAKPEEIEAFFSTTRPAEKSAYTFEEGADPEYQKGMSDALWQAGISEYQYGILKEANDKAITSVMQHATSAEGFANEMKATFGEKYDHVTVAGEAAFKRHLTPDQGNVINAMPNKFVAPVYALVQKYEAEIAAIKEQYGVKENGDAHLENGGTIAHDVNEVRKDLRAQINKLVTGPHTVDQKQALVDKLQATYK